MMPIAGRWLIKAAMIRDLRLISRGTMAFAEGLEGLEGLVEGLNDATAAGKGPIGP